MCYFLEESTNTMLSVLFATEDYYTIKEINNVEESFCQRKLLFWWQKFRKTYFALAFFFVFFAGSNYHFADTNCEKLVLRRHLLAKAKSLNCKGWLLI